MADTALNKAGVLPNSGSSSTSGGTSSSISRLGGAHTTAILKQSTEGWVEWVRCTALAIFVAVPFFAWFVQPLAGRVVWTVVVALLPLFIVLVGYHRWRRICPLAFFSKLPGLLGMGGKRTFPVWVENNYHYLPLGFFIFGVWMRLVATNGDGQALALFFVAISLGAFAIGAVYTGKSWCNYVCPVSFIEKIYTEPHGLRETANSQCPKCTACKKFCPDINQENGYWKEIEMPSKKAAYLAFPGIVFGFYFYYFLQSGTWDYYYGGGWTNEPGVWRTAFFPGHDAATAGFYFFQEIPRAAAALLTLLACGALSCSFFSLLERPLKQFMLRRNYACDPPHVRHVLFSIAAFTAFVCFYSFAGAPTLRLINPAPHLFLIVVVLTASIYLARRMSRTQRVFAEETLAKNIVKRWEWPDAAPKDLREAFLVHTIRAKESQKSSERSLEIYKESVREAIADGLVTRAEVHRLEALRDQLQIKKSDHDKIMSALDEEERALLVDPSKQMSSEKRLQLDNYSRALEKYLESALTADGKASDALIAQLRNEYRVTPEEHKTVLEDLLGGARGIGSRLSEAVASIERAAHTIVALGNEPTPAHDFIKDILERRRTRAVNTLVKGLTLKEDVRGDLIEGLCSNDPVQRELVIDKLRHSVVPVLAERLLTAHRQSSALEAALKTLPEKLKERTRSADPYERALAVYITGQLGAAHESGLHHVVHDEHEVVRDTVSAVKNRYLSGVHANPRNISLSAIDKMIALRSAPIFSRLEPESLDRLARACRELRYEPGQALCSQGENGDEVFIIVEGDVEVVVGSGESRKLVAREKSGGFIGELAVLDPAPRSATVLAGQSGARALKLEGSAFRDAMSHDPSIAAEVIKTLAQRLKQRN